MYHEPLVRLSKKICEIAPGDFEKRVTFGLTGSDANDGIIKFARAYTGRPYMISFHKRIPRFNVWRFIDVRF